ncbi:hypothetical protein BXZ70DRAFT_455769 [Cristinia sonorae]|uniref:NACHT domain-containing protein n=1 Tax=Cristinia sonorae TaxID=1940300 RepID=A0A8K0UK21_9AGAR|nr:hypothetical protein BXZ70DRAFT_455769 [Cristinia sonorae]
MMGFVDVKWNQLEKYLKPDGTRSLVQLTLHGTDKSADFKFAVSSVLLLSLTHSSAATNSSLSVVEGIKTMEYPVPIEDASTGLVELVAKLQIMKSNICRASEIYPVACMTWAIVSRTTFEPNWDKSDRKATELLSALDACYGFVEAIKHIKETELDLIPGRVMAILRQTVECVIYLMYYFNNRSHVDTQLRTSRMSMFLNRIKVLTRGTTVERIDTVMTYRANHDSTMSFWDLPELDSIPVLGWHPLTNSHSLCLPGTRNEILEEVSAWLVSSGRVYVLHGESGAGKSAIAKTLTNFFGAQNRLAARVFFSKESPIPSSPDHVIRNLAYQFAKLSDRFAGAMAAAVRDNPTVLHDPIHVQFATLLTEPLSNLELDSEGPLVVVLDGLDQCGTPLTRSALISVLNEQLDLLPPSIRFFITTRDSAPDTFLTLQSGSTERVVIKSLADRNTFLFDRDIPVTLRRRLVGTITTMRGTVSGFEQLDDKIISELRDRSSGSFMWINTLCTLLAGNERKRRLKAVLALEKRRRWMSQAALDDLFSMALEVTCADQKKVRDTVTKDFQTILGILLVGEEMLEYRAAEEFVTMISGKPESLNEILSAFDFVTPLPSLSIFERIRIHATVYDFLTDPSRCRNPDWYIDVGRHRHQQALVILDYLPTATANVLSSSSHPAVFAEHDGLFFYYASYYWIAYVTKCPPDQVLRDRVLFFILGTFGDWFAAAEDGSRRQIRGLREWLQRCTDTPLSSPHLTAATLRVLEAFIELESSLPSPRRLRDTARLTARLRVDSFGLSQMDLETVFSMERSWLFADRKGSPIVRAEDQTLDKDGGTQEIGKAGGGTSEVKDAGTTSAKEILHSVNMEKTESRGTAGTAESSDGTLKEKKYRACYQRISESRSHLRKMVMSSEDPLGSALKARGDWLLRESTQESGWRQKINTTFMSKVDQVSATALHMTDQQLKQMVLEAIEEGDQDELALDLSRVPSRASTQAAVW